MRSTGYAAIWQDGGPALAGRIVVEETALEFEGAGLGGEVSRRIPYASVVSSRVGRAASDRVRGRPALVVELSDGKTVRIATPELGALHELEEALRSQVQRDHALVHDRAVLGG